MSGNNQAKQRTDYFRQAKTYVKREPVYAEMPRKVNEL